MYNCETGVEDSPSRVGNFLISYANEVDLVSDLGLNDLKHLLNADVDKDLQILSNTDSSFIPRAFTDADLLDGLIPRQDNSKELVDQKDKPETVKSESSHLNGKVVFTDMAKRPDENMDNFKPDVVLSNSHHRSGPDGSPALAPPATRGFMNANISETSELFAPVRTLTFSDIDQSSHIEDSYVNTSRLVSTPNKDEQRPAANQYDYSSMQGAPYQTGDVNNLQGNGRPYVDDSNSSDSDNVVNVGRDRSPEFRQLEGEAESDFQSTGPFHPSAQGLSKEFMDQFVGKTSNPGFDNDMDSIFSPLGSNGLKVSERRMESRSLCLYFCLSICASLPYFLSFCMCFSAFLSVFLYVPLCLSFCISICASLPFFLSFYMCLSALLSVFLYVPLCLLFCISICVSLPFFLSFYKCLSVFLSVFLYFCTSIK